MGQVKVEKHLFRRCIQSVIYVSGAAQPGRIHSFLVLTNYIHNICFMFLARLIPVNSQIVTLNSKRKIYVFINNICINSMDTGDLESHMYVGFTPSNLYATGTQSAEGQHQLAAAYGKHHIWLFDNGM